MTKKTRILLSLFAILSCETVIAHQDKSGDPQLRIQVGHKGRINSIAIDPKGNIFASGSEDGTIRIWEISTGREVGELKGSSEPIETVSFSPDSKTILSGGADQKLRLWDMASLKLRKEVIGHRAWIRSASFSPDGKTIASGDHWEIHLWNASNGQQKRTIQTPGRRDFDKLAFSDNHHIISTDGSTVRRWNINSGKSIESHTLESMKGIGSISSVSVHPKGEIVAIAIDNELQILRHSAIRKIGTIDSKSGGILSTTFSPDGRYLISGGDDNTIHLWDVTKGEKLLSFLGHSQSIRAIAFSPDGKKILSGSDDGTIKIWTVADGKNDSTFTQSARGILAVSFNNSGSTLATAGYDRDTFLWNTNGNRAHGRLSGHTSSISSVAFNSEDDALVTASSDNTARIWDPERYENPAVLHGHQWHVTSAAFDSTAKLIATGSRDGAIRIWDRDSGKQRKLIQTIGNWHVNSIAVSPSDPFILCGTGSWNPLVLYDIESGQQIANLEGHKKAVSSVAFTADGKLAASGSHDETIIIWEMPSRRSARVIHNYNSAVETVSFSPDGATLAAGGRNGIVRIWNVWTGQELVRLLGHTGSVESISFRRDGNIIATGSTDGKVKLWRVSDGKELATLVNFTDGSWVVTDPEGRFDTADLESMPHLHWVMPDDPFTPVPLEAFMKDYYEPRLLARILAGETFKPVRALTSLNRTQPEVKIVSVVPEGSDPSLVRVTVSAAGATKSYLQGEGAASKEVARPTAVHDLRLFRDGQVVGYADGKLADFSASASGSAFTKTFTVRLPRAKAGQDVVFSAYAFNDDRVKSETVRSTYKAPALSSAVAAAKGRAYVISMGVNQHENSAWNLGYAANDARAVAKRVSADLNKSAQYAEVVPLVLAADGSTQQASKATLRAVLARLAGQVASPADQAALQGVAGAELLRKAQPDDLLLISFAGHGFADDAGQFYLVPQDTGSGSGKQITSGLKAKSISSEELSLWLRDVDAGDMTMIVDACQSAASVQAEGFKPGPMGSRGLGQLSFDKGMRILAASQSDEFALEDQRLKHGLLTFSLINDGLEAFNADFEPQDKKIWLDEWLKYGVKRVPTLAEEVKSGTVKVANRGPERGAVRVDAPAVSGKPSAAARPAQQPALFDFAKKRQPVVLGVQ